MEINEKAPGNISQCPVTRTTDNETGFDPGAGKLLDTPIEDALSPTAPPIDPQQRKPLPDEEA